jgi:GTPase SAR1 family protein
VIIRPDRLAAQTAALARSIGRVHLATLLDAFDASIDEVRRHHGATVLLGGTPHCGKTTLAAAVAHTLPAGSALHFLEVGDGGATLQRAVLRGFAPTVDGVVLAIRAGRALEPDDRDTLAAVAQARVPIALCATKSDLYPTALTQSLLLDAVRSVPGVRFHAVAADLALAAPDDADVQRESGLTQLHSTIERELLRPCSSRALADAAAWSALAARRLTATSGGIALEGDVVRESVSGALDRALSVGAASLDTTVALHATLLQRASDDAAWRSAASLALRDVAEQIGAMVTACADELARCHTDLLLAWSVHDRTSEYPEPLHPNPSALTRAVMPAVVRELGGFADELTRPWELPGIGPTHSATAADARVTMGRQRSSDVLTRLPALGERMSTVLVDELRTASAVEAQRLVDLATALCLDAATITGSTDPSTAIAATSLLDSALALRNR